MEPTTAVSLGLAAAQGIGGLIQTFTGDNKADKLRAKRKAFQTPEEIFKILQATTNRAASGLAPDTLAYLTNELDRSFTSTNAAAKLLGADPNMLGENFDRKVNAMMKIGEMNQAENIKNFTGYINALDVVAANKAAEQKSIQDMLKDDIQAAVGDKQAGVQNVGNALNTVTGALAAEATGNLYEEEIIARRSPRLRPTGTRVTQATGITTVPRTPGNIIPRTP